MTSDDEPTPGNEESLEHLLDVHYDDLAPGVAPGEQATGRFRILQIVIGVFLVAAGIVMMVIPGPGIVTVLVGLNMIKPDNAIVRYIRRRTPGIPEDGSIPRGHIVLGAVFLIGGTVISILYGAQITGWLRDLVGI